MIEPEPLGAGGEMKTLILGASGATGRLVVSRLAGKGIAMRLVAREGSPLPEGLPEDGSVEIIRGNIAEFDRSRNRDLVEGCGALVCCLGHTISFRGIYGKPRDLVVRSLRNACEAIEETSPAAFKVVLMSTVAGGNGETAERRSLPERAILSTLKAVLPPHRDNGRAARYLLGGIGKNHPKIEWTAVRPDSLVDEAEPGPYDVFESIRRSPLFDPGRTSRAHVAHFMAELLTDEALWREWKFRMPVVYDRQA